MSTVALVPGAHSLLDQPCWIILINLVTLDLLRTTMAQAPGSHIPVKTGLYYISVVMTIRVATDIRHRPRLSIPSDKEKYTIVVFRLGLHPLCLLRTVLWRKVGTVPFSFVADDFFPENFGSESEYSQILEHSYGRTGYSVRWR